MAGKSVPKWILDAKEHISKSKEWSGFIEELYDAIQQQLKESHVQSFQDLTEPERNLFMERAAKAIHGGQSHTRMYSYLSVMLDQHANNEVARQLMEDYPTNTKTDLVLEATKDGAVSLLKKWPDMKSKLHVCFNQPLPESLRQIAWKLFLENTKVRKRYVDHLNTDPRKAISELDLDISTHCEKLLLAEPTFSGLKGSVGAFYGMKAVLSYHHALKKTQQNLPGVDYLLAVPFVSVASNNMPRKEPAPGPVVALLVEEYLTFMASRPSFMDDSTHEVHTESMKAFCGIVAKHLQTKSPETVEVITNAFLPAKETIVATEKGSEAILSDAVQKLAAPVIKSLFTGYVQMEVLLFIWDQYVIGLDSPGFHDEFLPAVTAIYLMLVKDKMKNIDSPAAMESAMRKEGVKLTVPQFQYQMTKHFYNGLFDLLNADVKAALPVLDPTQATYPPWVNWFSDKIPPRTTPQDRHRAREEREAERNRIRQAEKDEEMRRREEELRKQREEDEKLLQSQEEERRRHEEERLRLEDQLEEERKRRFEAERKANDELERLQRELEELKRQKLKTSSHSILSLETTVSQYLIPPPPSAATHLSPNPPPQSSAPRKKPPLALDFLRRVANSFNTTAHGVGEETRKLDQDTKQRIIQHKDDVKEAEREVFGRYLRPGEFDELPHNEKLIKSDEIMDVIKKLIQQRRAEELRLGNTR